MKNYIYCLFTLTILIMGSCKNNRERTESVSTREYPVLSLEYQTVETYTEHPVSIRGAEDTEIRPRIEGIVKEVYIDEGTVVVAGQALFRIDSPSSEMTLTTAQANVSSAQAAVNTAAIDVERYRPLAEEGIVSETLLRTYENAHQTALATLEQAEAVLKNARTVMEWATVTSPIAGVTGTINYRTGSLVNASNVMTTVANTTDVYAYFSLNEKKLDEFLIGLEGQTQTEKIKNIPPVTLFLAGGKAYSQKGQVETITGTVDITTGTANFRVRFPNIKGELRSGNSGNIRIPTYWDKALLIPQDATFSLQDKTIVYKLVADSVVQQDIIVRSMPDGAQYIVNEGLHEGDRIVTEGINTLSQGMKIRIKNIKYENN